VGQWIRKLIHNEYIGLALIAAIALLSAQWLYRQQATPRHAEATAYAGEAGNEATNSNELIGAEESSEAIDEASTEDATAANGRTLTYEIETTSVEGGTITFTGWAFAPQEDMGYFDTTLALRIDGEADGDLLLFATAFVMREDITEQYGEGTYNYDNCGFEGRILQTALDEDETYELCIIYNEHTDPVFQATGILVTRDGAAEI